MLLDKSLLQLNTQFNQSLAKVPLGRFLTYIGAQEVFNNSRRIGEEIVDLFLVSYPAFKSVLAMWLDLMTTTSMKLAPL